MSAFVAAPDRKAPPLMTCPDCGTTWTPRPRKDGTPPRFARCPVAGGGCGRNHRVTLRAAAGAPAAPGPEPRGTAAPGWDPPSNPRQPRQVAEPCPGCGEPLWASPRGTVRGCLACGRPAIPAGVAAPYRDAGDGAAGRVVVSRRDRDAGARDLARTRGRLLAGVRKIREDPRLDPADTEVCDFYTAELRKARTADRLAELAEEISTEQWHTRHWWQAAPDHDDDDDGDGYEPGGQDQDDDGGALVPAARAAIEPPPAPLPRIGTWLRRRGVTVTPGQGCPVTRIHDGPYRRCGQPASWRWNAEMMASPAAGTLTLCRAHYDMLNAAAATLWRDAP